MHISYTIKIDCHKRNIRNSLKRAEGGRMSITSMAKYFADARPRKS